MATATKVKTAPVKDRVRAVDPAERDPIGRFVKGNRVSPGRKPLEHSITNLLRQKLDVNKFVDKLLGMAYGGDIAAIREVYRRLEGEVPQPIVALREDATRRARDIGLAEDDVAGFVARAEEIALGGER